MIAGLLFGAWAAAGPPVVEVRPIPLMPRPEVRRPLPRPPLQAVERALGPRIDGVLEGAWQRAKPAESVRSMANQGPPDPDWAVRAWISDRGLTLALSGVGERAQIDLTVDPDASRRGWLRISVREGRALFSDCRATPDDAYGPIDQAWSVATWDCAPPIRALAAHGADGWEIEFPWTSLGSTTDDLQVNARIIDGVHSLSLDPMGTARDYTAHGRTLRAEGIPERSDRLAVSWDRTHNRLHATLSAQPATDEVWVWRLIQAGEERASGRLTMRPDAPRADVVVDGVEPSGWPYLLARRVGPEPLAPGAWRHLWVVNERGTLSTPVYTDRLIARIIQDLPAKEVPVEVRDASGRVLFSELVDLPRGASEVHLIADPAWPGVVQLRIGDRFAEGWLTAVRAGESARRLGGP